MVYLTLDRTVSVPIPEPLRRKFDLGPGDEIAVEETEDAIVIRKSTRSFVERLAEFGGPMWRGYADEIRRDRDEWDR